MHTAPNFCAFSSCIFLIFDVYCQLVGVCYTWILASYDLPRMLKHCIAYIFKWFISKGGYPFSFNEKEREIQKVQKASCLMFNYLALTDQTLRSGICFMIILCKNETVISLSIVALNTNSDNKAIQMCSQSEAYQLLESWVHLHRDGRKSAHSLK